MSLRLVFNYSEALTELSSLNVTLTIARQYYSNGAWTNWETLTPNNNQITVGVSGSTPRRIRITLESNGTDIYTLAPLSNVNFNSEAYYLKSGTIPNTYDGIVSWLTGVTPESINSGLYLEEDNVKISDNKYQTIIYSSEVVVGSYYHFILPKIWYSKDSSDVYYNFTSILSNVSCSVPNGQYLENSVINAVLTPNNTNTFKYGFKNIPTCTDSSATISYDSSNDSYTISFTITSDTTINANAVNYFTIDMIGVINAICNYTSTDRFYINENYHITIESISGYYFDTAPTLMYQDNSGVFHTITFIGDGGEYETNFYCDLLLIDDVTYNSGSITASAIIKPISDKLGLISIYLPTSQQLSDLADERFITIGGDVIDLGEYITKMFRLYVNIPVDGSQEIVLGMHNTQIVSNITLHDTITINCGDVDVEPYFNNIMDFNNTYIKLFLPLYGFVSLETKDVMNKSVHIEYKVNILNGDALILVYADDILIETYTTNCSYEVPYILNRDNTPKGRLDINSSYLYGFVPFIEIRRDTPYNTSLIAAPDNKYVALNTLIGYNEVTVNTLPIQATHSERVSIEQLLRDGVIF